MYRKTNKDVFHCYIQVALYMDLKQTKEDIDKRKAAILLEKEWKYVSDHQDEKFLDSSKYGLEKQYLKSVLQGSALTYRYFLLTAALAKAVNPNIHYRALQKGSQLIGAYDARSVAHEVVVPFEKSHGERLGGSNEPYLNRPARYPEFDLSNRDRNKEAQRQLYELLEKSQEYTKKDRRYPLSFLREVLREIVKLDPRRLDFHVPPVRLSFDLTERIIDGYLSVSGSGERLVAVCAATFASLNEVLGNKLTVKVYPVNWPDRFARTAGDLEFYLDDRIVRAAEIKDKPLTEGDVRHCVTKAQKHGLTEYMILLGAGVAEGNETTVYEVVKSEISKGLNVYLINVPKDLKPYLIYLGEGGRKIMLTKVGEYLNSIKATRENKHIWQELLDTYSLYHS